MSSINPIVGNILQQAAMVMLEAGTLALSAYVTNYITKKSKKSNNAKKTRKQRKHTTSTPTESLGN